ncbi:hypothetical protein M0Q97_12945 [Candidatus Dojkabacteria bacterium]|jgi:hypothetical protein|nr:hypothetical protein [Candidatus Dojkabacteria bacterium]
MGKNKNLIKPTEKEKKNQDIIDFRHELIDKMCSKSYNFGVVCNDNKTNVMTEERKKVLNDVLIFFNNHFGIRGYDLG